MHYIIIAGVIVFALFSFTSMNIHNYVYNMQVTWYPPIWPVIFMPIAIYFLIKGIDAIIKGE